MDEIKDNEVRCVKEYKIWNRLLELKHEIVDVNKDKSFICPYYNEKCTFKSVLYFRRSEEFDRDLEQIYKELEEEKKLKEVKDG